MRHRRLIGVFFALSALTVLSAHATKGGVYRWFDDRGNLHYDDQNLLAERITRATLNQRDIEPEPPMLIPPDFIEEVKLRCTDFRERAQSYQKAGEIYARDPNGNSYRLSSRQVSLAQAEADRLKQRFCRNDAAKKILIEERAARIAALAAKSKKNGKAASTRKGFSTPASR